MKKNHFFLLLIEYKFKLIKRKDEKKNRRAQTKK